jgi:hypothetical protein
MGMFWESRNGVIGAAMPLVLAGISISVRKGN